MAVIGLSQQRMWVQVSAAAALESTVSEQSLTEVAVPAAAGRTEHPWDLAHRLIRSPASAGLESMAQVAYAEPDLVQSFPYERLPESALESFARAPCAEEPPDGFWPVGAPELGWHLDDAHSQLRSARNRVGDPGGRRVRIAILDTGYDPAHASIPVHLRLDLQRNLADGDPNDATDPGHHFPLNQPGHGTATMALLAGGKVLLTSSGAADFLGGAPFADVVPVRIADSVIHFRTSSMSAGINYAVDQHCDVVSISMGGVPTRAWAEAVNRAYDAGVVIVAAAGNRFGPSPPSSIIYPARFHRVIAACGVAADGSPYYRPGLHRHMQGCFGPASKMTTAIAAYTPNAPWAVMGCETRIGFGGGTSSATPQVAAAAALWLQMNPAPVNAEPWQKVEAVRWALFASAAKDVPDLEKYFGQGLLRADAALNIPFRQGLPQTPPDEVSFPWFRLLGVLETVPETPAGEELMYEVEALQVFFQTPGLEAIAGGADPMTDEITSAQRKQLAAAMQRSPLASRALRDHLAQLQRRM
jgi:subtilisin family serine protease